MSNPKNIFINVKYQFVTIVVIFTISLIVWLLDYAFIDWNLLKNYSRLKPSLVTGFITVGGFMLSLKTFILGKQKEMFSSPSYEQIFLQYSPNNSQKLSRYAPLENVNNFVTTTIFLCVVTSFSHVVATFFENQFTLSICAGLTSSTFFNVFRLTVILKRINDRWINHLKEQEEYERISKETARYRDSSHQALV